jgi:adenylate kinase
MILAHKFSDIIVKHDSEKVLAKITDYLTKLGLKEDLTVTEEEIDRVNLRLTNETYAVSRDYSYSPSRPKPRFYVYAKINKTTIIIVIAERVRILLRRNYSETCVAVLNSITTVEPELTKLVNKLRDQ